VSRRNLWPGTAPQAEYLPQAASLAVPGRALQGGTEFMRRHALFLLGLACLPWLHLPAEAAGESSLARGVVGAMADSGSSSRDTRRRAIDTIPLARMPAAERRLAEQAIERTTLYRRLPTASIACDPALLDFVLSKPETLVEVWRVLGISRLTLDPVAAGQWRLADGYGTVGALRLLHRERGDHGGLYVFHGRGAYDGPLAPKQLTGSCLVVVRITSDAAAANGRPRQTVQIDAFLDVDGMGLELVTRSLQPLIVHSAAANLHEISLFVSQFAAAAARNPVAVSRIADRMTRTPRADRTTLVTLASGRQATATAAQGHAAEQVQAELAARWMTADQLDAMQKR